jgi:2-polyprenyl-3-methyl-5-hydroxy-6-metoxy-1,4-benzoquinol methylase
MAYVAGKKKDRQYGKLSEIRPDHRRRYLYAANVLPPGSRVLDLACGCGYGSWILQIGGLNVKAIDVSEEAIEYAKEHYQGPQYFCGKAEDAKGEVDALVTFETLEHLPDPSILLRNVKAKVLIASVPNEERYPFKKENFEGETYPHLRHYTPKEFEGLLNDSGYQVKAMLCQKDKLGYVYPGTDGLFLIAICQPR